ncbi:hypothetical protein ACH5RR_031246 [Cinchona calisaya]|uniref:Peptidase A1 domain-containing protein n=1 Tax=Cinchona calisaya TaxID=153742 RepID=A0ABD2YHN7_9GENT
MASVAQLLLPSILICFVAISFAQKEPFLPNSVILPVTKDLSRFQYVTQIYIGDQPQAPTKLVIDLSGSFSWMDSAFTSLSSASQHPINCFSLQCSMAKAATSCTSGNKTCTLQPENPITRIVTRGDLTEDIISVSVTDGIETGSLASISHFLFSSAPELLLKGLSNGVKGVLGLGNTRISLPSQVANTFGFQRKFSLCLSSSNGVLFSGQSPYMSLPHSEISKSLIQTPFVFRDGNKLKGYYISVKSIKINGKKMVINESSLLVNQEGVGGTKISTMVPYSTMESTLYHTFIEAYIKAAIALNMTMVSPVAPFGVCFSSEGVDTKRVGPNVPIIDLVLQSEMVKWRILGRNSMVQVSDKVMCLGFLDGGLNSKASFLIGGYQLEDNFLEFNLETSMLGFSSPLLMGETTCSNLRLQHMPRETRHYDF